jgi:hypothetical protein
MVMLVAEGEGVAPGRACQCLCSSLDYCLYSRKGSDEEDRLKIVCGMYKGPEMGDRTWNSDKIGMKKTQAC